MDSPNRGRPDGGPQHAAERLAREDALMLQQVRDALTPMPTVDRRAIADILLAVAARKPTRVQRLREYVRFTFEQFEVATTPLARGSALAAMALVVGFVARGALMQSTGDAPVAPLVATALPNASSGASPSAASGAALSSGVDANTASAQTTAQFVEGAADASARPVPVQFVLDARTVSDASTLSVVGDFNDWNLTATPMVLDGGVWSVTLPVTPGRHVYSFVVNGRRWVADPRSPTTADADFGRPSSVIIVQTP